MSLALSLDLDRDADRPRLSPLELDTGRDAYTDPIPGPSGGPRTESGKERSRRNATKHGLRARGLITEAERKDFGAQMRVLHADLRPAGELEREMLRRIAMANVRLDRCERAEAAAMEKNARAALRDWEKQRRKKVRRRAGRLELAPARIAAELESSAFGIDWLLRHWAALRADLAGGSPWTADHTDRALRMLGVDPRLGASEIAEEPDALDLWHAAGALLNSGGTAARDALLSLLDDHLDRLEADREAADAAVEAVERREVLDLALIDVSEEGLRRRRYERDAEREFRRSIEGYRQARDDRRAEIERLARRSSRPSPGYGQAPSPAPAPAIDPRLASVSYADVSAGPNAPNELPGASDPNESPLRKALKARDMETLNRLVAQRFQERLGAPPKAPRDAPQAPEAPRNVPDPARELPGSGVQKV